ncbi:hypothetical protein Bpfe_016374 [Biomphalaria pfeifferi]|uniref:Uncharacterized protein n=1 Tax=Biomphalaria pfeifferi TaxID=112525 RepID=A0AAD8F719_BIOPF|nr:hypothetical protein Bpfe_016374 [Biomphalaria pfeifferi]
MSLRARFKAMKLASSEKQPNDCPSSMRTDSCLLAKGFSPVISRPQPRFEMANVSSLTDVQYSNTRYLNNAHKSE